MNKQQIKGVANQVTGEIKQQVGRMTGDTATVVRGEAREIKGRVQQNIGNAREELHDEIREERALDREIAREELRKP